MPNGAGEMKILVACEYSGIVRDAFIEKGHDAMSCDILPTDKKGPHYQGDIFDVIGDGWDLMIAHPPCTYLTCSGEWAYKDVQKKKIKPGTLIGSDRRQAREEAVNFFMDLANANIDRICIENPVGVMSSRWRKPEQFIHPYHFGHDASKKTGLWLKNLPYLKQTKLINPRYICCGSIDVTEDYYGCPNCLGDNKPLPRWANQTDTGQNREPPHANRWKIRSTTWQGWADAMADQWHEVGETGL